MSKLREEARARTTWGDSREEVVRFLTDRGMDEPAANAVARELEIERNQSHRIKGFIGFLVGLLLLAGAVGVRWLLNGGGVKLTIVLGFAGGCLFFNGLIRVMFGGRGEGS